jgi:tetratricopeptide (TPR) repeat protein
MFKNIKNLYQNGDQAKEAPLEVLKQRRNPVSYGPLTFQVRGTGKGSLKSGDEIFYRSRIYSQDEHKIENKQYEKAKRLQKKGEDLYRNGQYFDSLTSFHNAVEVFNMEELTPEIKQENEKAFNIIRGCYLLSANCYINLLQYDEAISLMDELLNAEHHCGKALYRRAKCYHMKNMTEKAIEDLRMA